MISKHNIRHLAAFFLLLSWLIGQSAVIAHDFVIDHSEAQTCEWQCNTAKNQDFVPPSDLANSKIEVSFGHFVLPAQTFIDQTKFQRPYHRGPPR